MNNKILEQFRLLKKQFNALKNKSKEKLEEADYLMISKKIGMVIGVIFITLLSGYLLIMLIDRILSGINAFINRHLLELTGLGIGGLYIYDNKKKKKEKERLFQKEEQEREDSQKQHFTKSAYSIIGKFLYAQVCSSTNFTELCSLCKPIRPEDLGLPEMNAYIYQGIMYNSYNIPKNTTASLDLAMLKSVLQGLVDEKICLYGVPPIIQRGENRYLFIDNIEDRHTHIVCTFVLDFNDDYIQRVAYTNAMNEVFKQTTLQKRQNLEDRDYG